jgi:methanol dehydrogenase (cytochrome c) subunit 2
MGISRIAAAFGLAFVITGATMGAASAYDGTKCKAAGDCWEPKPGFPDKVAGSKYDPRHDPKELDKNQGAIKAMEERNRKRVENFKKTGKFVYEVDKIQ